MELTSDLKLQNNSPTISVEKTDENEKKHNETNVNQITTATATGNQNVDVKIDKPRKFFGWHGAGLYKLGKRKRELDLAEENMMKHRCTSPHQVPQTATTPVTPPPPPVQPITQPIAPIVTPTPATPASK